MAAFQDPNQEISALKEELLRTQLAYRMATEMCQFKAGFLARISHELRSPLNSLIGLQQLILSDLCEDAAEEREFVAQANASAMRMVAFMDAILNVARTEYGTNRLNIQPVQLAHVLTHVDELTRLQAADRNLPLDIEKPAPEIYVLTDSHWLKQVLMNLVDTPLKLMREGRVCVSIHPDPSAGYVHIQIEDQRPYSAWSEPIDLLQSAPKTDEQPNGNSILSPGLNLLAIHTLLELMKGRLELLAVPSPNQESNLTRVQCSIPLATR
ncbi:sensor histidine kinase [Microseira sp. BLCC-F43]|jgi:signal transduction histidine kinase|uniref:sensor histidine kinase n=1 Tax=Microseira sp. BLCC-F43 TaxID=3153602 RepID=UPI0035B8C4DB